MESKRALVTGGHGFVGENLVDELKENEYEVIAPWSEYDLRYLDITREMVNEAWKVDVVFHLAGWNGGLNFNRKNPGSIFYKNTVMGLNVLEACAKAGVKKVVSLIASCAYPAMEYDEDGWRDKEVIEEKDLFDGPPHDTVACHAYAKRNLQLASKFYKEEYGLNAVCLCPTTLYGPGDHFEPDRSKVVAGLIRKFVEAKRQNVECVSMMGTGLALREVMYVKDCAKLIVRLAERYDDSTEPLNIAGGTEIEIKQLANTIAAIVGYKGKIQWEEKTASNDGQNRKKLDEKKMFKILGGMPVLTDLVVGLTETVRWYEENHR